MSLGLQSFGAETVSRWFTRTVWRLEHAFERARASDKPEDDTRIRIDNGKLPWNYQLLAGFQLTPEQIDYNNKKSRYLP